MFSFQANIIKRRKVNVVSLFMGIIGAALVGYLLPPFLQDGLIPIVEDFIRQIGLANYTLWVYAGIFLILLLTIVPALKTIFQKKVVKGGYVQFDEENLKIIKGKQKFLIPGEELRQIEFELKNKKGKKALTAGGSFMKIPTQKGTFICELDINSPEQKKDLKNMIKVLQIQHEVKVDVKELK